MRGILPDINVRGQTLANAQRVLRDPDYAARTAVQLLDYLTRMDSLLGTGRLYAP